MAAACATASSKDMRPRAKVVVLSDEVLELSRGAEESGVEFVDPYATGGVCVVRVCPRANARKRQPIDFIAVKRTPNIPGPGQASRKSSELSGGCVGSDAAE